MIHLFCGTKRQKCVPKKCAKKKEMKKCPSECDKEIVKVDKCGCCHVECAKSPCPQIKKCRLGEKKKAQQGDSPSERYITYLVVYLETIVKAIRVNLEIRSQTTQDLRRF